MHIPGDGGLLVLEQLPTAAYVLQNDGFAAYNQAAVDLLGHPVERLESANYWDLCSPWIRDEVRERGRAWLSGAPMDTHSVCPVVSKLGQQKWIEVYRRRIAFRGSQALLVTALELTEHRVWIDNLLSAIVRQGRPSVGDAPRVGAGQIYGTNGNQRIAEGNAGRRTKALTNRQHQVLELVQLGWSNKQIAYELGITEGTTKLHVFHLMQIFDAPNRTLLALTALKTQR